MGNERSTKQRGKFEVIRMALFQDRVLKEKSDKVSTAFSLGGPQGKTATSVISTRRLPFFFPHEEIFILGEVRERKIVKRWLSREFLCRYCRQRRIKTCPAKAAVQSHFVEGTRGKARERESPCGSKACRFADTGIKVRKSAR